MMMSANQIHILMVFMSSVIAIMLTTMYIYVYIHSSLGKKS